MTHEDVKSALSTFGIKPVSALRRSQTAVTESTLFPRTLGPSGLFGANLRESQEHVKPTTFRGLTGQLNLNRSSIAAGSSLVDPLENPAFGEHGPTGWNGRFSPSNDEYIVRLFLAFACMVTEGSVNRDSCCCYFCRISMWNSCWFSAIGDLMASFDKRRTRSLK
jgi:hypothetical protein